MDITVAICTWNRADQLQVTLEAMTHLKIPAGVTWELMVVDNNSSDSTPQVIESFSDRLPMRAIHEPRQGKSFALNRAISEAKGEFIFWTDDDVTPDPLWLEATYNAFEETNADLVYGIIRPRWATKAPSWYSDSRFSGKFALLDHGQDPFVVADASRPFYGANNAGRREVLKSLQGYREDLGPNGDGGGDEDTEFFERALQNDAKIIYEPKAIIWHMIGDERCQKRFQRKKAWRSKASYLRALQLKTPRPPMLFNLPRYLYRIAFNDVWKYMVATLRFDRSDKFFYELKLVSFVGIFYQGFREKKSAPPNPQTTPGLTQQN